VQQTPKRELQPASAASSDSNPARRMTPDQIRAEAKRLIQQEKFDADCNRFSTPARLSSAAEWDSSLRTFQMLGGASR
jgi:hypothetical protein